MYAVLNYILYGSDINTFYTGRFEYIQYSFLLHNTLASLA